MVSALLRSTRLYSPEGNRVSHLTVKPGDRIGVKVRWQNTGSSRETFLVGVSIGNPGRWFDVGYYDDEHNDYGRESTAADGYDSLTRNLLIPDAPNITDVYVTLRDENKNIVASEVLSDVITLPGLPAVRCPEGTFRCDPDDINVSQKCVDGVWVGWQSCPDGCDPATGRNRIISEEEVPEVPADILDKVKGILRDILFEGIYVQDALVKWKVLPAWVGTIFNKVIDFLSVNVAPEGERPIRIMVPGGSFITKVIPKISTGVADDVVRLMIREGSEALTAKIMKSPTLMSKTLSALPEEHLTKLFRSLGPFPEGRLAMFQALRVMTTKGTEKAVKAIVKAELPEEAAEALYRKVGPEIGSKFYKTAGKSKYWKFMPPKWLWFVGMGAGVMGYASHSMWTAKEAVWEAPLFPFTDLIRDEKWGLANETLPRLESALDFYEKTADTIGWLSPVSRIIFARGIKEARENIELWRRQITAGLKVVPVPVITPIDDDDIDDDIDEVVPGKAWITIKSNPEGAGIYIDGKYIYSDTNFIILQPTRAEPYTIQLSAPSGYKNPPFKTITVSTDRAQTVDFGTLESLRPDEPEEAPISPPEEIEPEEEPKEEAAPVATQAYLTVTSKPSGASIWLDGENTWTVTPFAHLLDEGSHNIQLQLFRHEPVFQNITIKGGENIVKSYELKALEPVEVEKPFIPVPVEIELIPKVPELVVPTAWEYTITARDVDTGEILGAKIIVNGIYTGKYTTNKIILEPEAEYLLRLEAFGYEPGEGIITTEALPE